VSLPEEATEADLGWIDEWARRVSPHLFVRPEDELLILVPNRPCKLNRTAIRMLSGLLSEGLPIAEVLAREAAAVRAAPGVGAPAARVPGGTPPSLGPTRLAQIHSFFVDLADLVSGRMGEGFGRASVIQEAFSADFCRFPVLSELALTSACNLDCAFCYAGSGAGATTGAPSAGPPVLATEEALRLLAIIRHEALCPSVSFTGGEPTLHPDLPELVARGRELGMWVNLITNGQRLAQLAPALADAGLSSVQVSLEGPDAALHDALVGRKGAFERLWQGVEALRLRGVSLHTNTTVNRRNVDALLAIVDLLSDRGLDRFTMNLVIPTGSATRNLDALRLSYSEIGPWILRVRDRAEKRGMRFVWYSPLPMCVFNTVAHGLGNQGCAACDGLLHVDSRSRVRPCSSFPADEAVGDLSRQDFSALWQSEAAVAWREKRHKPEACQDCRHAAICQGACVLYWRAMGESEIQGGRFPAST
jgi:radical SAM protein with 4Fe4S-binding SPASM domain